MIGISKALFKRIAIAMPGLKDKLRAAEIESTPEDFIKKTLLSALYLSVGVSMALAVILQEFGGIGPAMFFLPFGFFLLMSFYFMKAPDVKMIKKDREINQEIVFGVRFLIIELESGVPLYNAMKGVARNYEVTGKYFKEIVDRIDMGTPLEEALNESIEITSSANFRRILWQIVNSLRTGADVGASLGSTVDQIATEQIIEVKEYGRKLNPLAMFYMMIAIIIPSIGMVMVVMMSSLFAVKLDLPILIALVVLSGFIQFMFYSIIKSSRPAVGL